MQFADTPLRSSRLLEAMRGQPKTLVYSFIAGHGVAMALAMIAIQETPPREVVEALAIGREAILGTPSHPPLASWCLGIAFWLGGGGFWALAVAGAVADMVALWAVFHLSRAIVGERQAAIATFLLAGVAAVTWRLPWLDQDRLLLPLFALTALHLWRAAGQRRRRYWGLVALDLALLALAKYSAGVLAAALLLALLVTPQGRAVFRSAEPWGAAGVAALLTWPHLLWITTVDQGPLLHALGGARALSTAMLAQSWAMDLLLAAVGHGGLVLLVGLAVVTRRTEGDTVPVFPRPPLDRMAVRYAAVLALAPAPAMALAGLAIGQPPKTEYFVPLFAFSGLGTVLLLGAAIPLYRHVLLGRLLVALTLLPPLVSVLIALAAPFSRGPGADTNWPSTDIARWFTEVYRIRTGQPLGIVAGDAWTAGTLVLASADRPRLYLDGDSARAPWISDEAVARSGVLVVWRVDGAGTNPPAALRARFPGMTLEPARSFDWAIAGRLAPIRLGWAIVPPAPK